MRMALLRRGRLFVCIVGLIWFNCVCLAAFASPSSSSWSEVSVDEISKFYEQDNDTSSSSSSSSSSTSSSVPIHPFLVFDGFIDGSWWVFFMVAVASSRLAMFMPRIGLPLITGYMVVGCLCGPYVLNIVTNSMIPKLSYVTQTALAFIAYSAGSELYLPELRSLFRTILYITGFIASIAYTFCMFGIWGVSNLGLMTWTDGFDEDCKFGISLLAASIMTSLSPASAIAVVKELRAKGNVTSIMLGVVVVCDLVVLILFSLSASFTQSFCAGGGFDGWGLIITVLGLLAAVGFGYFLGALLIFLLWIKRFPARFTILPIGFLLFVFSDWFANYSTSVWQFTINLDALLICITAGYVVTNKSKNRIKFLQMLSGAGPYVFIPFFTLVGVALNLNILIHSLAFACTVWLIRALSIFLGCYVAGHILKWDVQKKTTVWLTFIAQAGVSVGLAAEAAVRFPAWGLNFQAAIIAVILINQLVGPVVCKWVLKKHGEDGKMSLDDGEHGEEHDEEDSDDPMKTLAKRPRRKHVLIIGIDHVSLAYAQRMLDDGCVVVFFDTSQKALDLTESVVPPKERQRLDLVEEVVRMSVGVTKQVVNTTVNVAVAVEKAVESGVKQGVKLLKAIANPDSARNLTREESISHSQRENSTTALAMDDLHDHQTEHDQLHDHEQDKEKEPSTNAESGSGTIAENEEEKKLELSRSGSSASVTGRPSMASGAEEQFIFKYLLMPSATSSLTQEMENALTQLKMTSEKYFTCALVSLRKDIYSQEAALHLVDKTRMGKVLARCKNPAWAPLFAAQGITPFFGLSSNLQLMHTTSLADDHLQIILPGKNSMPDTLLQCVRPLEDLTHYLLSLPEESRTKYEDDNPPPNQSQLAILEESYRTIVNEELKLGAVIPEAHRDFYIQTLGKLKHDADHSAEGRVKHFELEMDAAGEAFTSPALMEQTVKARRKRDAQKAEKEAADKAAIGTPRGINTSGGGRMRTSSALGRVNSISLAGPSTPNAYASAAASSSASAFSSSSNSTLSSSDDHV